MNHFANAAAMAGYTQAHGVPAARAAVLGSGALLLLGGLSVLLGIWPDLGALLLAVFLVPTALLMHAFWKETDHRPSRCNRSTSPRTLRSPGHRSC